MERFLHIALFGALTFSSSAFAMEQDRVFRYRQVRQNHCATALFDVRDATEGDFGRIVTDRVWEEEIDDHEEVISRKRHSLSGGSQYQKLKKLEQKLLAAGDQGIVTLRDVTGRVDYLDQATRDRWQWLRKTHHFRFRSLRIGQMARLGSRTEVLPADVDREDRAIRFNLLFDLDAWLQDLAATDLMDPEIAIVETVADATFLMKTRLPDGRIHPEFAEWLSQSLDHHLVEEFVEEEFPTLRRPRGDWHEELREQAYAYFRERHRMKEGMRYYKLLLKKNLPTYHELYARLLRGTEGEQGVAQDEYLIEAFHLSRTVFWHLYTVGLPARWTEP